MYCENLLHVLPDQQVIPYFGPPDEGSALVRVERFIEHFEQTTEIPLFSRAEAIAEKILDAKKVYLFKDKINFRHPGSNGFGPHQDAAAGWDKYAPYFVSIAVFVKESRPETGGFEFALNASPNMYYPSENGKLFQTQFEKFQRASLNYPAGDAIAFDSYAPHQTHRNSSTSIIPHIILTFNDARHGSHRPQYYAEKIKSMRQEGEQIRFRVFEFGDEYAK